MIDVICVLNDYIYAFMFYIANLAFYMFSFKYMHQNILKYVLYKKRSQNGSFLEFCFLLLLPDPNSIGNITLKKERWWSTLFSIMAQNLALVRKFKCKKSHMMDRF